MTGGDDDGQQMQGFDMQKKKKEKVFKDSKIKKTQKPQDPL